MNTDTALAVSWVCPTVNQSCRRGTYVWGEDWAFADTIDGPQLWFPHV